jgi:hypothetical protein
MPKHLELLDKLLSKDRNAAYGAFTQLITITNKPVPWAHEAWDRLLGLTRTGDNHQRTMAVQMLANLTKSDYENRMRKDLNALIRVTKDPMFVTARHSLLCLWKVGIKDENHQRAVLSKLTKRFKECVSEKNCTLIRYDIQTVLRHIYDARKDETVLSRSRRLIDIEQDPKYREKYATVWRQRLR